MNTPETSVVVTNTPPTCVLSNTQCVNLFNAVVDKSGKIVNDKQQPTEPVDKTTEPIGTNTII